jgi:RHS repeat-associated protein
VGAAASVIVDARPGHCRAHIHVDLLWGRHPDGVRMVRRDPNGTSTVFLDGQEVVYNSGVNTVVSASRYYAGSSTVAVRSSTGGLTFLGADHQGTIMATLTTGGVSTRQRYKPYGSQRGTSNALTTERGFIGQVEDTAVGLVYLNARHYDPTNGVFVFVDPLPTGYSYLYASGNPMVNSDPTGLCDNCGGLTPGLIDWDNVYPPKSRADQPVVKDFMIGMGRRLFE